MPNRSDAIRRHHRERVIANRLRFIRDALGTQPWRPTGSFAKRKPLDCSCPMCQMPSKPVVARVNQRAADRRRFFAEE